MEISLEMLIALGRLDPRDREVVIDRTVLGHTLQAVGDRIGLSKERVRQRERRALDRLRVELEALAYDR